MIWRLGKTVEFLYFNTKIFFHYNTLYNQGKYKFTGMTMDIYDYEKLLEKAYDEVPENVKRMDRFEIPKVELRYEGKNTFITNFSKIINVLNRNERHFLGVFLKKVGTMGEIRGQMLFMKGKYKPEVLNRLLEDYTKTYVLCKICNRPDTLLSKEGKKQYLTCTACGNRAEITES
ncbi:MAG: translation initiation factor IF-2 subunit beta [Promethearchaeota archaeon]